MCPFETIQVIIFTSLHIHLFTVSLCDTGQAVLQAILITQSLINKQHFRHSIMLLAIG